MFEFGYKLKTGWLHSQKLSLRSCNFCTRPTMAIYARWLCYACFVPTYLYEWDLRMGITSAYFLALSHQEN